VAMIDEGEAVEVGAQRGAVLVQVVVGVAGVLVEAGQAVEAGLLLLLAPVLLAPRGAHGGRVGRQRRGAVAERAVLLPADADVGTLLIVGHQGAAFR